MTAKLTLRRARAGRLFVAPNVAAVAVFLLFPLAFSLYLSFHQWNLFSAPRFVGTANYRRMATGDPLYWISVRNTAVFTVLTVSATLVIGSVVAATLNRKLKGITIFRSVVFLPLVASTAAMAVVWRFVFNTDGGLLNHILAVVGLGPVDWLNGPGWALVSLCIVSVWKNVPFATVVLLAAMQAIPEDVYDAAKVDGAREIRRFRSITLPLIRPALSFVLVISLINAVQVFDQAYVLTGGGGGPETGTYVYGLMMFQNAFAFDDIGYACALAWVMFAVLLTLTVVAQRFSRRDEQ